MWSYLRSRFRRTSVIDLLLLNFSQGVKIMSVVTDIQASFDAVVPVVQKAFADGAAAFSDVSAKYDVLTAQIADLQAKLAGGGIVVPAELTALQSDINTSAALLATAAASQETAAAALEAKINPPAPVPDPTPAPTPDAPAAQ